MLAFLFLKTGDLDSGFETNYCVVVNTEFFYNKIIRKLSHWWVFCGILRTPGATQSQKCKEIKVVVPLGNAPKSLQNCGQHLIKIGLQ
mgnify:CR=1 FL=1